MEKDRIAAYNLREGKRRARKRDESIIYVEKNPALALRARKSPELIKGNPNLHVSRGEIILRTFSTTKRGESTILEEGIESALTEKSTNQKTAYVIYRLFPDIESGIRGVDAIYQEYKRGKGEEAGEEVMNVRKVVTRVKNLSLGLATGEIQDYQLQDQAEETAQLFAQTGFLDARKDSKTGVVEDVMKALSHDRMNRFNPSRSRWILSHAWLDLIDEMVFQRIAENKYLNLSYLLERERARERFVLSQAENYLDQLTRTPISSSSFQQTQEGLSSFVEENLKPTDITINPYAFPSVATRLLITGPMDDFEADRVRSFTRSDAGVDGYFNVVPLSMMRGNDAKFQAQYLRGVINNALSIQGQLEGDNVPVRSGRPLY